MRRRWAAVAAATAGALAAGAAGAQQKPAAPVATYWMTADTSTGGPGGFAGAMSMLAGGDASPEATHTLVLQLASTRAASAAPSADHLPPPGLKAGARLPLVTPKTERITAEGADSEAPKTKVLVYWGCGAQARPGQPRVIDLAKPGAGAAGLGAQLGSLAQSPPSPGPGRTYGEWPNKRGGDGRTPAAGSLIGEHVVRGNYSPEIRFSLGAGQDFLPPLKLSGTNPDAVGATPLAWRPVSGAQGYFASVVGATDAGDMVIWTSSEVPLTAGQIPDYLSPSDLKRLIGLKAVMGPQATQCVVPPQVGRAAPAALLRMVAFGGEANVVHPPRPADPKAAWSPEYAVKVRYASRASAVLGLSDESDASDPEADADAEQTAAKPTTGKRARSLLKGLGAIAL